MFPAPLEVDRWIYSEEAEREARYFLFPAPLEVDRGYTIYYFGQNNKNPTFSGPSRGR